VGDSEDTKFLIIESLVIIIMLVLLILPALAQPVNVGGVWKELAEQLWQQERGAGGAATSGHGTCFKGQMLINGTLSP
jgi:hypothetical protein